jgi:hypothetical protein
MPIAPAELYFVPHACIALVQVQWPLAHMKFYHIYQFAVLRKEKLILRLNERTGNKYNLQNLAIHNLQECFIQEL